MTSARRRPLPTRPARPIWTWLLPLLLLTLAAGSAAWWLGRPHNPPLQPAAQARTVTQDWTSLAAFGPRPPGTSGHDQAGVWLRAQFQALGYRVTEQPLTFTRAFPQGGALNAGTQTLNVTPMYGASSGEQTAPLLRVPPNADTPQLEALGLRGKLALTTCPASSWKDLANRVIRAGAFGLLLIDDCASHALQRVDTGSLPVASVPASDAARVLALAGQTVTLRTQVEWRTVTARNLIAARVGAQPQVLLGAHYDTVNATLGANDNGSGVLAVLDAARRAAGTPLAERLWFVLFDAEEDGLLGSAAFVPAHRYPMRQTRAMLNMDMTGVNTEPLSVAGDPDLLRLARRARPDLTALADDPMSGYEKVGRVMVLTGQSDHVSFMRSGIRTLVLHRGMDAHYHSPQDTQLDPALVTQTSQAALDLAQAALNAPWTPREPCGITGRNCR